MNNNQPIGVFDSGMGGLTAVKAIKSLLPNEDIIYLADTIRMPYGDKPTSSIIKYAEQNIKFLRSCGVKTILAACGTISSYLELINSGKSVLGVIYPSCLAAVNKTRNGKIGILATKAAIQSNSYANCLSELHKEIKCYQQACPKLAPLIEHGRISAQENDLITALHTYISPLIKENVDTIILGCTHYAIIEPVIRNIFGDKLILINSGEELANTLKKVIESQGLMNDNLSANSNLKIYVSGDENQFLNNAQVFLGKQIKFDLEKISLI